MRFVDHVCEHEAVEDSSVLPGVSLSSVSFSLSFTAESGGYVESDDLDCFPLPHCRSTSSIEGSLGTLPSSKGGSSRSLSRMSDGSGTSWSRI
jgi:hypothetical protein